MTTVTYPGVYIEEIPSGQHIITGVATSIAAFIGWANQGPVGNPVMVESWSEYQATFGGMIPGVYLGYAVYQFFQNGGSQAYIVRLVQSTGATAAKTSTKAIGGITFSANSPGLWGDSVSVAINHFAATSETPAYFNVIVTRAVNGQSVVLESFTNLTATATDPRYAVSVINSDSNYIIIGPPPPIGPPGPPVTPPTISMPATTAATVLGGGSDGAKLIPDTAGFETALRSTIGYSLLANVPIFNILCVPGETKFGPIAALQSFCVLNRAFLIVDSDQTAVVGTTASGLASKSAPSDGGGNLLVNASAINSAFYFPWVNAPDPQVGFRLTLFPPSGFVAGIYAATDASRGVWKAPAGVGTGLTGAAGLQYVLSDGDNGKLNPLGINCLRQFPTYGNVVWGARTIAGADAAGSQWQYVPIRRFTLFLESSLYQGTQWAVFEPNAAPLWAQVRLSVGSFLQGLFLQGAFAGTSPQQAYFVKCDAENNPPTSVAQGILNIMVGFAPLYPAEFIVIQIQQMTQS